MGRLIGDIYRLKKSFGFAFYGIRFAVAHNQNFQISFLLGFCALFFGFIFKVTYLELVVLAMTTLLLIASEMINTAIEEMVNLIAKDHRQEARIAKDVSAGMVVLILIGSLFVYTIILLPYLLQIVL